MTYVLPHTHNIVFMIQQTEVSMIILGEEVLQSKSMFVGWGLLIAPRGVVVSCNELVTCPGCFAASHPVTSFMTPVTP